MGREVEGSAMRIERMTEQDISDAIRLWSAAGFQRVPSGRSLTRFLKHGLGMVARAKGRMVAATLFSVCGPSAGYFEYFAVAPDQRRKRIGTRLYRTCIADLYRLGVRQVILLVDSNNDGSEAFWRFAGGAPIRRARPFFFKLSSSDLE